MAYQLNSENLRELSQQTLNQFSHVFHQQFSQPNRSQTQVQIGVPDQVGRGGIWINRVGGTLVSELNFKFIRDMRLLEYALDDMCFLNINLGTPICFDVDGGRKMIIRPNTVYLGQAIAGETFSTRIQSNAPVHSLSFCFSKQDLSDYLHELGRPDLDHALKKHSRSCMVHDAPLTQKHHQLLDELKRPLYGGTLGKLKYDTVMQALLLSCLESLCLTDCRSHCLNDSEIAVLEQAQARLLKDHKNPPTIPELARVVGVNQDKLKKGFQLLFNQTILQTLTHYRMSIARTAISRHDMSVAEASEEAGYDNVSHFIAVFKRHHGQTPGEMRKQRNIYLGTRRVSVKAGLRSPGVLNE